MLNYPLFIQVIKLRWCRESWRRAWEAWAVADLSPWSREGKSPTICDRSELDNVPGIDQCSNRAFDLVHLTAEEPYVAQSSRMQ